MIDMVDDFPLGKRHWTSENLSEAISNNDVRWISCMLRHAWNPLREAEEYEIYSRTTRWGRWMLMKNLMDEYFLHQGHMDLLSLIALRERNYFTEIYSFYKDMNGRAMFFIHVREQYELVRILYGYINGVMIDSQIDNGIEFTYLYHMLDLIQRNTNKRIMKRLEENMVSLGMHNRRGIKKCNGWFGDERSIPTYPDLQWVEATLQENYIQDLTNIVKQRLDDPIMVKLCYRMKIWYRHLWCGMLLVE